MILKLVGMFILKHDADSSWWYKQGSREEFFHKELHESKEIIWTLKYCNDN